MKTTRELKKNGKPRLLMTKKAVRERAYFRAVLKKTRRVAKQLGLKTIWCGAKGNIISLKQLAALRAEQKAQKTVA